MKQYSIAALAGDGIGPEVTNETIRCLDRAAEVYGFAFKWNRFPFNAEYYLQHGTALPESGLDDIGANDALLLGAIGDPRIPPGPLEQEILLRLRFHFDQYINLRPALSFPGIPLPVALPKDETLDVVVVRENTEDFYMGIGGSGKGSYRAPVAATRGLYSLKGELNTIVSGNSSGNASGKGNAATPAASADPANMESAFSLGFMSRPGIERVARYACDLARKRGEKKITVVSKANAVPHLYGFWDKVTSEIIKAEYPDLAPTMVNVDAICYLMVRTPSDWGVVLCPNLFGDIVSDLLSGLAGGLGLAAAGNIGAGLSMFEPVHGSAPTIKNTGKANPLAAILSGAMLLRHLGEESAAASVEKAVTAYLSSDMPKPMEQTGSAKTPEVGAMVSGLIRRVDNPPT